MSPDPPSIPAAEGGTPAGSAPGSNAPGGDAPGWNTAAGHGSAGRAHAAPRPQLGSGAIARLATALYALILTPIATGLLAYGGTGWYQVFISRGYLSDSMVDLLTGELGVRILGGVGLGLLLLASVVATGIVSSAGLLVVGVLGVFSLVVSAAPRLLFSIYQILPSFVPVESIDSIVYGLPLVLHSVMGGLGAALVIARRRPDQHLVVSLLGLLVVPAVLLAGAALTFGGIGRGLLMAVRTFNTQFSPVGVLLLLLGALLLWLGAAATRWSPYAQVIPALALLAATLLLAVPSTVPLPSWLWSSPMSSTAMSFLLIGGGVATAVVLLVHTGVLAVVRQRARRRLRAPGMSVPPTAPTTGTPDAIG